MLWTLYCWYRDTRYSEMYATLPVYEADLEDERRYQNGEGEWRHAALLSFWQAATRELSAAAGSVNLLRPPQKQTAVHVTAAVSCLPVPLQWP